VTTSLVLRKRVVLITPTVTTGPLRGPVEGVPTETEMWAHVEPLEGRELLQAQQVNASLTHRVTIRYRAGVAPTQRLRFGTKTLEILSIVNPGEANRELQLLCVEAAL
jgi:SPP1 family predicted phage head-tail adaptor